MYKFRDDGQQFLHGSVGSEALHDFSQGNQLEHFFSVDRESFAVENLFK
jgi:hypothetical protein